MVNDMHDGTVSQGDTWLQTHIDAYAQWAKTHNSLLIVTWDEDDYSANNLVATIFVGEKVAVGTYSNTINHYNILRTIEDMYGLPHAGAAATATPITNCWTTSSSTTTYTLTLGISPATGNKVNVNPPGNDYTAASQTITENAGASVTLTATPASGQTFQSWSDGSTANPKTITMNASVSLTATFASSGGGGTTTYTLTLNISPANGNTVAVNPPGTTYGASTQNISENSGATVTLTANPTSGQTFQSWSDGTTANPKTITMNSSTTITANFASAPPTYTLTLEISPATGNTVSVDPPGTTYSGATQAITVPSGSSIALTATPASGQVFQYWSDGTTTNPKTIVVNSNTTMTANFAAAGTGGTTADSSPGHTDPWQKKGKHCIMSSSSHNRSSESAVFLTLLLIAAAVQFALRAKSR